MGWQEISTNREVGDSGALMLLVITTLGELFPNELADEEAVVRFDRHCAFSVS